MAGISQTRIITDYLFYVIMTIKYIFVIILEINNLIYQNIICQYCIRYETVQRVKKNDMTYLYFSQISDICGIKHKTVIHQLSFRNGIFTFIQQYSCCVPCNYLHNFCRGIQQRNVSFILLLFFFFVITYHFLSVFKLEKNKKYLVLLVENSAIKMS